MASRSPRPSFYLAAPPLYRAEEVLYMCGTVSLHTDWRGPAARPGPGGSGYSLLPSHSVLPSGIVDAARYGGTAVGDVRGRVAHFRSGRPAVGGVRGRVARFLSCRLRLRRFRVDGRRRGRRGAGGSSMLPCRRVSDGARWLTSPCRRSDWQMASRMDAAGQASSRPGSQPAKLLAGQVR